MKAKKILFSLSSISIVSLIAPIVTSCNKTADFSGNALEEPDVTGLEKHEAGTIPLSDSVASYHQLIEKDHSVFGKEIHYGLYRVGDILISRFYKVKVERLDYSFSNISIQPGPEGHENDMFTISYNASIDFTFVQYSKKREFHAKMNAHNCPLQVFPTEKKTPPDETQEYIFNNIGMKVDAASAWIDDGFDNWSYEYSEVIDKYSRDGDDWKKIKTVQENLQCCPDDWRFETAIDREFDDIPKLFFLWPSYYLSEITTQ